MECTSKLRRKKRKTRRILNEIRTRLCNQLDKDYPIYYNSDCKSQKVKEKKNYLTTNRLTLGLFHKVVRSETITRLDLAKIGKQAGLNVDSVLDKTTNDDKKNYLIIDRKYLNSFNNTFDKIGYDIENSQSLSQLDSPAVFSSVKSQKSTSHFGELVSLESDDTLIWPFESPQSDNRYQMYEQFIQSLPEILIEKFPAMFRGDAMKKTKNYLHNLYLTGCQRKTKDNILEHINDNLYNEESQTIHTHDFPSKTFFEDDPINYIKLGYVNHQVEPKATNGSTTTNTTPNSPMPNMTIFSVSPPFTHDTPEYIYYPHKLNQ